MKTSLFKYLIVFGIFTKFFLDSALSIPAENNFQGVLLDGSGNGVTGTRAMTLKLYDAAIGGNLLYTEDLGNVSVNKGVYSFNFGTNGTGNPKVTEIVAIASGTNSTFQKVLGNTNVVTGSVSVTDGTYSWDQINGPSDGGVNFDASYSTSLRRITVNYYNGAPPAGRIVRVTYRSPSAGLAGILANENNPWLEVAVNGVTQSPRQKLLAVPFAMWAANVDGSTYQETIEIDLPIKRFDKQYYGYALPTTEVGVPLPIGIPERNGPFWINLFFDIPHYVKEVISIAIDYSVSQYTYGNTYIGRLDFYLLDSTDQQISSFSFPRSAVASATKVIPISRVIPNGDAYRFHLSIKAGTDGGDSYGGGYIRAVSARVKVLKSTGLQ